MPDATNTTKDGDRPLPGQGFPAPNPDGTPSLIGPDAYTRQRMIDRANAERTVTVGGNYADLQRMGELIATGKAPEGVAPPPDTDPKDKNVITDAQASAIKGEVTRETIRTGLLVAPPETSPGDGSVAPVPVDPTSTSPTTEGGKSSTPSPAPQAGGKR